MKVKIIVKEPGEKTFPFGKSLFKTREK